MNAEIERAAHAATVALAEFDRAGVTTVLQAVPALAQTLRELLAAVTTPAQPDDDVREALTEGARDSVDRIGGWKHLRKFSGMSGEWMDVLRDAIICRVADALGEVRPGGTVTDAEVGAAADAMRNLGSIRPHREFARAALEAAREVRP